MTILENVPLSLHTTLKIGGAARFFIVVEKKEDIPLALSFVKKKKLPHVVLGGGSNVLFRDEDYKGAVLRIAIREVSVTEEKCRVLLSAAAGEEWDFLVERTVESSWWGIENLSGIPGTVGGAVVQNIGAYGMALSQTLSSVIAYDKQAGSFREFRNDECVFGYRTSLFKKNPNRYLVICATFSLSKDPHFDLSYKDFATLFASLSPNLQEIRNAVLKIRKTKFPNLSKEGTAGSFFRNPVVSEENAKKLEISFPGLPTFPLPEAPGMRKIPLAWLLDYRHGVIDMRGVHYGEVRVFERQPLVVVADKNSKSGDVERLANYMEQQIKEKTGIAIEREVVFFP